MSSPPKLTRDERRRQAREARVAAERASALRARRLRQLIMLAVVVVIVGAGVGIAIALSSKKSSPAAKASGPPVGAQTVNALLNGIPQNGITLGRPDAPVTLVEFGDLKCPICREYDQQALPTLIAKYVRTGKVRMQYQVQHFVGEEFNPGDSLRAARMAEAAGLQNRFWNFAMIFYANQQDETTRYVTDPFLRRIASGVAGLNVAQAFRQRGSATVTQRLKTAGNEFDSNGFSGTPSFLLGRTGQTLSVYNPSSFDPTQFARPIDKLLAR